MDASTEEATLLYARSVRFVLGSVLLPQQMLKTLVPKLVIYNPVRHPPFCFWLHVRGFILHVHKGIDY